MVWVKSISWLYRTGFRLFLDMQMTGVENGKVWSDLCVPSYGLDVVIVHFLCVSDRVTVCFNLCRDLVPREMTVRLVPRMQGRLEQWCQEAVDNLPALNADDEGNSLALAPPKQLPARAASTNRFPETAAFRDETTRESQAVMTSTSGLGPKFAEPLQTLRRELPVGRELDGSSLVHSRREPRELSPEERFAEDRMLERKIQNSGNVGLLWRAEAGTTSTGMANAQPR